MGKGVRERGGSNKGNGRGGRRRGNGRERGGKGKT